MGRRTTFRLGGVAKTSRAFIASIRVGALAYSAPPPSSGSYSPPANRASLTYEDYDSPTYEATLDKVGVYTPLADLPHFNSPSAERVVISDAGVYSDGVRIANSPLVLANAQLHGVVVNECTTGESFLGNVYLDGPATKPINETGIIAAHNWYAKRIVLKDCTIAAKYPSPNTNGIIGHNFWAERVHMFWVVDAFGTFTNPRDTSRVNYWGQRMGRATNAQAYGCRSENHVYYHGSHYADYNNNILKNDGTYTQGTTNGTLRELDDWTDDGGRDGSGHPDGNHADGNESQHNFGGMRWIGAADFSVGKWVGDGTFFLGCYMSNDDVRTYDPDPSGLGIPVPGGPGSWPGSKLGTQDSPKRTRQYPGQPLPATGFELPNGKNAINGQCHVILENVGVMFEFPNPTEPSTYSVVVKNCVFDNYKTALSIQRKTQATIAMVFDDNRFRGNVMNPRPTNAQITPIRIAERAKTFFGGKGLSSNRWDDPDERWGKMGASLTEGRTTGIVYDA